MHKFALSLVSALVGGGLVLGLVYLKPNFFSEVTSRAIEKEDNSIPLADEEPTPKVIDEQRLTDTIQQQQQKMLQQMDSFFNDDFFSQNDPFEDMRRMRDQMDQGFFDDWFEGKFGGGSLNDIEKSEDENFVFYKITVPDKDSTTIETKVENRHLTVTGKVATDASSSTFTRTFPLPPQVDPEAMTMDAEGDDIIIRFPKLKN